MLDYIIVFTCDKLGRNCNYLWIKDVQGVLIRLTVINSNRSAIVICGELFLVFKKFETNFPAIKRMGAC